MSNLENDYIEAPDKNKLADIAEALGVDVSIFDLPVTPLKDVLKEIESLSFGEKVKRLREYYEWTKDELMKRARISRGALIKIESGGTIRKSFKHISRGLARAFKVPVRTLLVARQASMTLEEQYKRDDKHPLLGMLDHTARDVFQPKAESVPDRDSIPMRSESVSGRSGRSANTERTVPEALTLQAKTANGTSLTSLTEDYYAVRAAAQPIQFLRNIVDTKELSQNMIEAILSALFSNKKLTLAFDKKLKGLESKKLLMLIGQLERWKEATARDNPKMKKLLDNFIVFKYDDLKTELDQRGIDAAAKDSLIFTYAPKPVDDSENTARLGSAVRPVYVVEQDGSFPENYYYPLLEMVTVSLAKELLQWDEAQLKDALARSGITEDIFGIDAVIDEKLGILIFKVLPKMERYENNARVDRYTSLLKFLYSA
jgi:transcriptional regulator with XRE-family HTH domain